MATLHSSDWNKGMTETRSRGNARAFDDGRCVPFAINDSVLFQDATIITMDPEVGDFAVGDLLMRDGVITGVGAGLRGVPADAIVIDARGYILVPGFQDTHRHCWQGVMRRLIPNVDDNEAYIRVAHEELAPLYSPQDIYEGNRLSALGAIDAGITTMMDFSHNSRTDEHADAAVHGLADTGIRAVHANCGPVIGDFSARWPRDLQRLAGTVGDLKHERITLRMGALCLESIGGPDIALSPALIEFARNRSLGISVDAVLGREASSVIEMLSQRDLLGPDMLLIHCSDLSSAAWRAIVEADVKVALAPTSDAQIGIAAAIPPIQDALDAGVEPSLSVDVEIALSGDMFTQMRTVLNTQRMLAFSRRYAAAPDGAVHGFAGLGVENFPPPISARDVLRYATLNGAKCLGLDTKAGSLTPGKRADFLALDAQAINNMPLNHAVGTVVNGCDARNITAVVIDGIARKWNGALTDVDLAAVRHSVEESRDRLMRSAGLKLNVVSL